MTALAVLTNPHTTDRLSASGLASMDLAADQDFAEFLAAAPKMARALNAILRLDLDQAAERLIREEIRNALG
ncbi:MAG: hypothetical protein NVS2B15_10560 [Pseudarthrobacter sp.]